METVYPLKFEPIFKQRIWGGRSLERLFGKSLPPDELIGESWELADLAADQSIVAVGPQAGAALGDVVSRWGRDLLGPAELFDGHFPLLIKFLDAEQTLSVQVHPDEQAAKALGAAARPKYEAWYVLDAGEESAIYCGLLGDVTKDDLESAARDGTVSELLHRFDVKCGDFFYLPAGTVHTLGGGLVVAEVQTPSDVTYRLFDWNRVDPKTGKSRELHVEQALRCARIEFGPSQFLPQPIDRSDRLRQVTRLLACEAFVIDKVCVSEGVELPIAGGKMRGLVALAGSGRIGRDISLTVSFSPGDTVLLPAALDGAVLHCDVDCTWLEVTVPDSR